MKVMESRPLRGRRIVVGAFLMAACLCPALQGCAGPGGVNAKQEEARAKDDDAFAAGGDRPPNANTLYSLARILATQGRDSECEYLLTRILQRYPQYLPAYSDMAELYLRTGRPEDAARVLNAGLSRTPNDPVLQNNLGMCWLLRGEYAKALDAFTAAAAAAPGEAAYRSNRATALGMLGRYDEAARLYETVLPPADVAHNLAVLRNARNQAARAAPADVTRAGPASAPAASAP